MLRGVDSESREADGDEVREIVRYALLHRLLLRVDVHQARQPTGIQNEARVPAIQ